MNKRFDLLEFVGNVAKHGADRERAVERQGFQREDAEVMMFAGSLGGTVLLFCLTTGQPFLQSVYITGLTITSVPTYVYGTRVLGRTLPDHARAFVEVRAALGTKTAGGQAKQEAQTKGSPTLATNFADDVEAQWRNELRRWLLAVRLCGTFSIRQLAYPQKDEHGHVTRPAFVTDTGHRQFVKAGKKSGFLDPGQRLGHETDYAHGYNYGRAVRHVQTGKLVLPTDKKGNLLPPPRVNFTN